MPFSIIMAYVYNTQVFAGCVNSVTRSASPETRFDCQKWKDRDDDRRVESDAPDVTQLFPRPFLEFGLVMREVRYINL